MERIEGFLFSPSKTFDASKKDTIGDAFNYYVVILVITAVLAIVAAVPFLLPAWMAALPKAPPLAAMVWLVPVAILVVALVGGIVCAFILGLWLHLWVYLVGGRKGLDQTLKAVMYGATPNLLLLGVAPIWAIIVVIIGVKQLHALPAGRAALAVILALICATIIVAITSGLFLLHFLIARFGRPI
ncbi:MAG: YIP1 family protein [Candidatus Aenigmarchaeota archaeon]|nr:YIP1 family protein [Candidatus Aenigmarchaeota archaeon]